MTTTRNDAANPLNLYPSRTAQAKRALSQSSIASFLAVLIGYVAFTIPQQTLAQQTGDPQPGQLEKGTAAYQSYDADSFDTINLANGNLMIHIPLLSYPQRGTMPPLTISVRSNSQSFSTFPGTSLSYYYAHGSLFYSAPWISYGPMELLGDYPTSPTTLTLMAFDEDGSSHALGMYQNGTNSNGVANGLMESPDGSGLQSDCTFIAEYVSNCSTIVDRNGIRYTGFTNGQYPTALGDSVDVNWPFQVWTNYGINTAYIEDPSGNTITYTLDSVPSLPNATPYLGFSIVDTIGRILPPYMSKLTNSFLTTLG